MIETLVQFTEYPKFKWESFTTPHGFTRTVLRQVPTCYARIPHVNTVIFMLLVNVIFIVWRDHITDRPSCQGRLTLAAFLGFIFLISDESSIWRECSTVPGLHWSEGEDRTSNFLWLFVHELFEGWGLSGGLIVSAMYVFAVGTFTDKLRRLNSSPPKLGSVLSDDELNGEKSCPVCYDAMDTENSVKLVACGHCFHRECILRWIPHRRSCPLCNKQL